jgi:uncharacterized membrane protein
MNNIRKKHLIICTAILISAALLLYEFFQVDPAVIEIGFVFIFIAYITLFLLVIQFERPRLSRCIYSFHLRAPPKN